jgi:hypothetical protein
MKPFTCHKWWMKPPGVICSSPLTRCPAGDALHRREGGHTLGLRAHHAAKTVANARRFLRDLHRACPIRIAKILPPSHRLQANDCRAMDNGKEFTDRLFASRVRAPSGEHEFDWLCTELGTKLGTKLGTEHRLTPPKSPQTNGIPLVHFPMHCRAAG